MKKANKKTLKIQMSSQARASSCGLSIIRYTDMDSQAQLPTKELRVRPIERKSRHLASVAATRLLKLPVAAIGSKCLRGVSASAFPGFS